MTTTFAVAAAAAVFCVCILLLVSYSPAPVINRGWRVRAENCSTPTARPATTPTANLSYFGQNVLGPNCEGYDIPVVVQSHNNPTLTSRMVSQLRQCFNATVIIVDVASDYPAMQEYLLEVVADPRVSVINWPRKDTPQFVMMGEGAAVLAKLPRFFTLTDSDLRFGDNTPANFLCLLAHLSLRLKIGKIGVGLDITDNARMWQSADYTPTGPIWVWEKALYKQTLDVPGWPEFPRQWVWQSAIDTTFAIYDQLQLGCNVTAGKTHCFTYEAVRVTGPFTAKHRPWYPELVMALPEKELRAMFANNSHSSFGKMFERYKGNYAELTLEAERAKRRRMPTDAADLLGFTCVGSTWHFDIPHDGTPL